MIRATGWLLALGLVSSACGDEPASATGSGGASPGGAGGGGEGGAIACPAGTHEVDGGRCEATLGAFAETSPLTDARDHHVTWAATRPGGSFVFVAGGALNMTTAVTTIERAAIGNDGVLASWETLPQSIDAAGPMVASTDARVFLAGGIRPGGNSVESESAAILDDGSLGPFEPGPPLHVARFHGAAVLHHGWIYATGGLDQTGTSTAVVERIAVDDDGFQGTWMAEPTELPEPRSHHGLAVHDGVLYLSGGLTRINNQFDQDVPYDTLLVSTIQDDGSVGPFVVGGTLPMPLAVHASFVHADHLYLVGGLDMDTLQFLGTVWRAPLADLDTWAQLPVTLPVTRGHCHQTPLVDGFLYSVAGTNDAGSQTAAFMARFE